MDLGSRIAAWRKSKGLSQRELAEALGLTPPAIYQWEDGTTVPSTTHLVAMAELLGITMERFYGRPPRESKESKAS